MMDALREPKPCRSCGGRGKIHRDVAGYYDEEIECAVCGGTGRAALARAPEDTNEK